MLNVAPLAGAWIEIFSYTNLEVLNYLSLPLRERGLKLTYLLYHV